MKKFLLLCLLTLSANFARSQALSTYSFSAFSCPYVPLSGSFITYSGGGTWGAGGAYDDSWYSGIPIGFNFNYCGTTYNFLGASDNGWVVLGQTFPATTVNTYDNDLDNGTPAVNLPRPILAALWTDANTSGPNVRYATTGISPYRVFTIEWSGMSFYPSTTGYESVEIKLYETSNNIDFCYSKLGTGSYSLGSCGIGITGGSGPYPVTGTQTAWSLNSAGPSPTPSMSTITRAVGGQPATNQVYRWSYQCAGTPAAGTVNPALLTGCSSYIDTLSLSCSAMGAGITYQWEISPDSISWTPITGATNPTYVATVTATMFYHCVLTCTATGLTGTTPGQKLLYNPPPSSITGPTIVCIGSTITLADATVPGTWSSSTTTVATIGSGTGVVTGVSAGTTTITYTIGSGCTATVVVTVAPTPTAIVGASTVCTGSATTLFDPIVGGSWSSSNTAVATVGSGTGIVTGVTVGTTVITYAIGTSCYVTKIMTVNPSPSPITGPTSVCAGSTITLSDVTSGGIWSSTNVAVATVGSLTGIVTGVSMGTTVISYTLATGCTSTVTITVNPIPFPITGLGNVCVGANITLSNSTGGGAWSSSASGIATVGATGIVGGVTAGTATISYTLATGCYITTVVLVNPVPAAITGTLMVCEGVCTTLSDVTPGGTWASSDLTVATINSTSGFVCGVLAGTANITYTLGTGCYKTAVFTVSPTPFPITGITSVCLGRTTTLSDLMPGGTWSSSNTAVATAGSTTGIVGGVTLGTAVITYTLPTGCMTTIPVTVYPNPAPITGTTTICVGSSTTLADATTGGTWSSSNTAVAPIISSIGLMTGLTAGTAIITYTLSTGCYALTSVTVLAAPTAITGTASVCIGATTTLSNTVSGGTWTSGNTAVATVGSTSGIVTGVTAGTSIITYSLGAGCASTRVVTVLPLPGAISGASAVCVGSTITLSAAGGGTWSSSTTSVATVVSATGVVTGVSLGTTIITYTIFYRLFPYHYNYCQSNTNSHFGNYYSVHRQHINP